MSTLKKIDSESGPSWNSALNIFTVPPTNSNFNRAAIREILPLNSIEENPYEFRIFSDNNWIDPSKVYLYLELSIEKKDGNNWVGLVDADTHVAPIQAIGQSFVKQLKMTINGTDVYDSTNLYPYISYIKRELYYPKDCKESFFGAEGYYMEKKLNDANDEGFMSRVKLMKNSSVCEFMSRLDFDLANQPLFLLNNLDILFTIYRSDDAFLIQTLRADDNGEYRVRVHGAKLYVKTLELQPSLNLTIFKILEQKAAKYTIRKNEIRSCYLSAQRSEISYNAFTNILPRRLIVTFVKNDDYRGSFKTNPFNFRPYDLREISVNAGGLLFPAVPYNMKFNGATKKFMRAFIDMHLATGNGESQTNGLSLEKFLSGWSFFIFTLTSTLDDERGVEIVRQGTTTIRAQFNTPIPDGGATMIILGEFDQILAIDQNRVVISDTTV
jgi:hypothetical protein